MHRFDPPALPDVEGRELLVQFLKLKPEPTKMIRSEMSENAYRAILRLGIAGVVGQVCEISVLDTKTGKKLTTRFRYSGDAAPQIYETLASVWAARGGRPDRIRNLVVTEDAFSAFLTIEGEKARPDALNHPDLFLGVILTLRATPQVQLISEKFEPGLSFIQILWGKLWIVSKSNSSASATAHIGNFSQNVQFPPNGIVVNVNIPNVPHASSPTPVDAVSSTPHPWAIPHLPPKIVELFLALEHFPEGVASRELKEQLNGVEPASFWADGKYLKKWVDHLSLWIQKDNNLFRLRRPDEIRQRKK